MSSERNLREIKKYEKVGIDVVVIGSDATLDYSTQDMGGYEYCNHCSAFRLLPDPDPYDWFRDGNKKAVCLEVNGLIAGSLEHPSEWANIPKPLYCPKLGRELSEEEKKEADKRLQWAKKMIK